MEKVDVVVVGAGPAGLTAAYFLAKKGFSAVVLERGVEVGSKNVFGGRVYSHPLDKYFSGYRQELNIERWVRKERLSILCENRSVTLEYNLHKEVGEAKDSFTVFLSNLLSWLASKVEEEGGLIATGVRADSLIVENNMVSGVIAGDDKLLADYVIIAEGSNGLLLEKHRIKDKVKPFEVAVGVKEVIKLSSEVLNERLGLNDNEGVAWFFLGEPLEGIPGGGFLYTMREHITLGLVVRLSHIADLKVRLADLIEDFRMRPEISRLISGGTIVEYSAKIVKETGFSDVLEKPYGNGYLVVGEAAGLSVNTGFTVRGVDFAIESGKLASDTIEHAHSIGSREENVLSKYKKLLDNSYIMRSIDKFKKIHKILDNPKIFSKYPKVLCEMLGLIYTTEEEPMRLREVLKEGLKGKASLLEVIIDIIRGYRYL